MFASAHSSVLHNMGLMCHLLARHSYQAQNTPYRADHDALSCFMGMQLVPMLTLLWQLQAVDLGWGSEAESRVP